MEQKFLEKNRTLTIVFVLLVLGVLAVGLAGYGYISSKMMKEDAKSVIHKQISTTVEHIDSESQNSIQDLNIVTDALVLMGDLNNTEALQRDGVQLLKKEMEQDQQAIRKVISFPNGESLSSDDLLGFWEENDLIREVFEQGTVTVGMTQSIMEPNKNIFMISVPILVDGTVKGAVSSVYSREVYQKFMETNILGQDGHSYIINLKGDKMLSPVEDTFFQQNNLFDYINENNIRELKGLKEEFGEGKSNILSYQYQGKKHYFVYEPLSVGDWYLISMIPESYFVSQSNKFHRIIFVVAGTFIITFGLLGFYFFQVYKKKQKEVEHVSYYDSVSGLPNSSFAVKYINSLPEKGKGYAYFMLYVKNFEDLNSLFGNETGKHMVEVISKHLSEETEEDEIACYLQNSTFSLLLKIEDEKAILERFNDIIEKIEKINVGDGKSEYTYHCKFQCGIYEITGEEVSTDDIINMANLALIEAKKDTSHKYVFFDHTMHQDLMKKRKLMEQIEEAFEKKEIQAFFQPQYELHNINVCGAEVVARWAHPEMGLIRTIDLMSLFEVSGKTMDLDLYILEEACKQVKKWVESERMPVPLWVNISQNNLYEADFVDKVFMLTQQYNVPTSLIGLEIRADILSVGGDEIKDIIKRFSDRRFLISVDHFATTSSMSILFEYPLSRLKLTDEFLQKARDSVKVKTGLSNLMLFCKGLEISSCVKGVETKEDEQLLKDVKCDVVQGVYYNEPFDMQEFENLIF